MMIGVIRIDGKFKGQMPIKAKNIIEARWEEIREERLHKRLAECDLIVCEPLYYPHYDNIDGQVIGHTYSHPEEVAGVLDELITRKRGGGAIVLLVPTPTFLIENPDVADILGYFPQPGTAEFEREIGQLCRKHEWAVGLRGVVNPVQLEQFARREPEFARCLLERYRRRFPLEIERMHHLGATLELLRCLTGSRVKLRQKYVRTADVDGVDGIVTAGDGLFSPTPPFVLCLSKDWKPLMWVGARRNVVIAARQYEETLLLVMVFDRKSLTKTALNTIAAIAREAEEMMGRQSVPAYGNNRPTRRRRLRKRQMSLQQHIDDFTQHLRAKGNTEKYCKRVRMYLERLFQMMECEFPQDVTPEDVDGAVIGLRKEGKRFKTVRNYISALKSFFSWGVERRRWEENPTVYVKVPRATDSVERRALSEDEIQRLFEACPNEERRLLYQTALYTGLRLSELRNLTWDMVDFNDGSIVLPATKTKSRKRQKVWLRSELVALLREHKAHTNGRSSIFCIPSHFERYFNEDLRLAGIQQKDSEERFDSLRHTFATLLSRYGVPVKVGQELMRHSDARLTLNIYTHGRDEEKREALLQLPWFSDDGGCIGWRRGESNPRPGGRNCRHLHG